MILTKYFEIRSSDLKSAKSHFERVILAVHSHNSTGSKLVVGWPKWASCANYFGPHMRVFGFEHELRTLKVDLDNDHAKQAAKGGRKSPLAIGAVADVPGDAGITWMFVRDRKLTHGKSPSGAARLIRRAISRGEVPKTYTPVKIEGHTLMVVSLSTNKMFPLDITRVRPTHLDARGCVPDSYGLGVPVPQF